MKKVTFSIVMSVININTTIQSELQSYSTSFYENENNYDQNYSNYGQNDGQDGFGQEELGQEDFGLTISEQAENIFKNLKKSVSIENKRIYEDNLYHLQREIHFYALEIIEQAKADYIESFDYNPIKYKEDKLYYGYKIAERTHVSSENYRVVLD